MSFITEPTEAAQRAPSLELPRISGHRIELFMNLAEPAAALTREGRCRRERGL
jgi:hypothetical protein